MNKSSLILILKSLNTREFREFGEMVHSPFFNTNQSTIKLFDYLRKHYPVFPAEQIAKEFVYLKIFHKADYNDGFMRSVIFNLAALAEEYLKQVNLKRNTAKGTLMLLDELNLRKLEKILIKSFPRAQSEVDTLKDTGGDYFYYKYVYEDLVHNYISWSRYKNKNMRDYVNDSIAKENMYLTNFFLVKILSIYTIFLAKGENITVEFDMGFLDDVITYILNHEKEFESVPAVMLYVNAIMLLKYKTDNYYYKLKEFLSFEEGITIDQKYSVHNILQTYCVHQLFSGADNFNKERLELYKLALEKKFFKGTQDIYFDDIQFTNIARAAMSLGEYEWAEKFINVHKGELSPENKDTVEGFLTGRMLFEKKEFEKGLKIMKGIKSIRHLQYKVTVRNLLLMMYYELSHFDQAENLLSSYRQFLSKNREYFAPLRFERLTDFLKYYGALLRIKNKSDIDELVKVIVEMNKNMNILERDWLMEKSKELEK